MSQSQESMLRGLRAAAEPSRLRLLGVLAVGEFTVSELTTILGQSQPRVSRHLKLLSDGGLLERFREQHWVFHRVPASGEGAELVRTLLGLLDGADPLVALDRERALAVLAERASTEGDDGISPDPHTSGGGASSDLAQVIAAELGERGFDAVLYAGCAPAEMLRAIGPRSRRVLGLSESRGEVQRARVTLHGNGLAHCELQCGDLPGAALQGASFDVVVIDRILARAARRGEVLREAARVLRPAGRLVIVEDYESLAETGGGNPLATVRGWFADAGLVCDRLRPVDTGAMHVLLATATRDRADRAA